MAILRRQTKQSSLKTALLNKFSFLTATAVLNWIATALMGLRE